MSTPRDKSHGEDFVTAAFRFMENREFTLDVV